MTIDWQRTLSICVICDREIRVFNQVSSSRNLFQAFCKGLQAEFSAGNIYFRYVVLKIVVLANTSPRNALTEFDFTFEEMRWQKRGATFFDFPIHQPLKGSSVVVQCVQAHAGFQTDRIFYEVRQRYLRGLCAVQSCLKLICRFEELLPTFGESFVGGLQFALKRFKICNQLVELAYLFFNLVSFSLSELPLNGDPRDCGGNDCEGACNERLPTVNPIIGDWIGKNVCADNDANQTASDAKQYDVAPKAIDQFHSVVPHANSNLPCFLWVGKRRAAA